MHVNKIVHHAKIYTADAGFAVLESFAIKDGKIVGVGTNESIDLVYEADTARDFVAVGVRGGDVLGSVSDL